MLWKGCPLPLPRNPIIFKKKDIYEMESAKILILLEEFCKIFNPCGLAGFSRQKWVNAGAVSYSVVFPLYPGVKDCRSGWEGCAGGFEG